MREYLAALAATAGLLCVSIALAQKEKPPAYKYHKDALVYAELAKAPYLESLVRKRFGDAAIDTALAGEIPE